MEKKTVPRVSLNLNNENDSSKDLNLNSARSSNSRKSSMSRNRRPISSYLKKYDASFSKDIDTLWEQHDVDKNGYLDKVEAKKFLDEISKVICQDRAKFYNPDNFETLFEQFDDDGNGFLSKSEMCTFIKMTFRDPN